MSHQSLQEAEALLSAMQNHKPGDINQARELAARVRAYARANDFLVAYDRMAAHINSCIEREGGSITASRLRELLTEYLKDKPSDKEALASHTMYVEGDGSIMNAEVVPSTDGGYLAVLMALE